MSDVSLGGWAEKLFAARRDRTPIPPLTTVDPGLTPADAYEIQGRFLDLLLAEGGSVVGYKLGLTSKKMQEMLGVDQPDYGPVLSSMTYSDGALLSVNEFCQPRIEGEIGLVLGRGLRGPEVTPLQAAQAVEGAVAALELVDSRIADWRITLVDTIADLASSAATVFAPRVLDIAGWDPRYVGMVLRRNGAVEATGAGAAAWGDPVAAVAWLANTLAAYDVTLEPGHVVLTGALHAAFEVSAGDRVRVDFDRLGSVACSFV